MMCVSNGVFFLVEKKYVKVCPNCKSEKVKQRLPQHNSSWFCLSCGETNFMPIELKKN